MPLTRSTAAVAQLFAALADPTRLRLLNLMNGREVCVCYFVEILRQSQPKVSRHLAYLRRAGLVEARREGKWMHYKITEPRDPAAARIFHESLAVLRDQPGMHSDIARLDRACCSPERIPAPAPLILPMSLAR